MRWGDAICGSLVGLWGSCWCLMGCGGVWCAWAGEVMWYGVWCGVWCVACFDGAFILRNGSEPARVILASSWLEQAVNGCCMKRPSGDGADLMDAKRPKEEGAPDENLDRTHTYLSKILQPPQPPAEKLSLGNISQYLEDEVTRLARSPGGGLETGIEYLGKGWRRCEEGGVVPSTWSGVKPLRLCEMWCCYWT